MVGWLKQYWQIFRANLNPEIQFSIKRSPFWKDADQKNLKRIFSFGKRVRYNRVGNLRAYTTGEEETIIIRIKIVFFLIIFASAKEVMNEWLFSWKPQNVNRKRERLKVRIILLLREKKSQGFDPEMCLFYFKRSVPGFSHWNR